MIVGACIAILNVVLTYVELIPFFQSISKLNSYTRMKPGVATWFKYPFRFISILPKAAPLALDGTIALVAGGIGLNGGVFGALIAITIGFTASLLVKVHRHWIAPRLACKEPAYSWK
jgi:hypothetical protein